MLKNLCFSIFKKKMTSDKKEKNEIINHITYKRHYNHLFSYKINLHSLQYL